MVRWSADPGQHIEVDGTHLEYLCHGPPPSVAPSIVMLHEGLGCVALWRDFPQQLAQATGLGVLVYSRQGYGRSDTVKLPRPLDYMSREAENTVGKVLDAAGLENVILLGHSDGASIACSYAGSVSDMRIRGLILIAPHFFTEPTGLSAIRAAGEAYRSGDLKAKLARYHDDVDTAFHGWYDAWMDPAFEQWNIADTIDHLRIPVLAIQGLDDPYGTLAQIKEIETRIYSPLETCILQDCRHSPHLEHPVATQQVVAAFCARLIRLEGENVSTAKAAERR